MAAFIYLFIYLLLCIVKSRQTREMKYKHKKNSIVLNEHDTVFDWKRSAISNRWLVSWANPSPLLKRTNRFTLGGVIAERVNTAKLPRRVNPMFAEVWLPAE